MLSLSRLGLIVGLLGLAADVVGQDQIPWAPNIEQAQQAATQQRKLVLLHFHSDHCEPCVIVEQKVFSQPQVAQAIARNYVPVKIHAGKEPKIAEQFRVDRWPTDIICTPAGLEIVRTISPKKPEDYIGMVDQVAMQTGVGAARQWQTSMEAAGHQVLDPRVAQAQAVTGQAAAGLQAYAQQAQQQVNQTGQQFQQATQQTQATAQHWTQRAGDTTQQMNSLVQNAGRDLQSAWNPGGAGAALPASPGSASAPSGGAYSQFAPLTEQPAPAPAPTQQAQTPPTYSPPSLPTSNPFMNQQTAPPIAAVPPVSVAPPAGAPQMAAPAPSPQFAPSVPAVQPAQVAGPLAGSPSPAFTPDKGLVPASQAPPIALEGYCPVTLLEAEKWKKADARFGAIHRGRTYLFASDVEQKKFLANPDGYSPVLSGFDPVVFAQRNQMVEGKRGYGVKYNQQVYLFENEASLQAFSKSPQSFASTARQAMIQADTGSRYR